MGRSHLSVGGHLLPRTVSSQWLDCTPLRLSLSGRPILTIPETVPSLPFQRGVETGLAPGDLHLSCWGISQPRIPLSSPNPGCRAHFKGQHLCDPGCKAQGPDSASQRRS